MLKSKIVIFLIIVFVGLNFIYLGNFFPYEDFHYHKNLNKSTRASFINWTKTHSQMKKLVKDFGVEIKADINVTGGCYLPDQSPWHPDILKFVEDFPEVNMNRKKILILIYRYIYICIRRWNASLTRKVSSLSTPTGSWWTRRPWPRWRRRDSPWLVTINTYSSSGRRRQQQMTGLYMCTLSKCPEIFLVVTKWQKLNILLNGDFL